MNTASKLVSILLLSISFSFGQYFKGFGIKTGLVSSNQRWNYTDMNAENSDKNYYGFYLGTSFDFFTNEYFFSNLEVAYCQKGHVKEIKKTFVDPDGQGFIETGKEIFRNRFDNISVAILGNVKYETKLITPYILFGPRFDILINRDIEILELSKKFEKFIYGYSFGAGVIINNFVRYGLTLELVSSPNINYLYKTESLKVSNYSYEIKFGIKLK